MTVLYHEKALPISQETTCDTVKHLIAPVEKDLGGFTVRRLLPALAQRTVGPFIFFDHMGKAQFQAGEGLDVRPHPHIGLATITYLFEGVILHRDSLGSVQPITAGDINLMIAGKGITHSERTPDAVRKKTHHTEGLQLWLALPENMAECDPAFFHFPAADIPHFQDKGVKGRVLIGSAYSVTSPVTCFMPTIYIEATLEAGARLDSIPTIEQQAVYVVSGSVTIGNHQIPQHHMACLHHHAGTEIIATEPSRIALIGGAALPALHMEWNFVSYNKERLEQAKADWQQGKFPLIPDDDKESIPLPVRKSIS